MIRSDADDVQFDTGGIDKEGGGGPDGTTLSSADPSWACADSLSTDKQPHSLCKPFDPLVPRFRSLRAYCQTHHAQLGRLRCETSGRTSAAGQRAEYNLNILVTGATGFVGSHLVPALVAAGHHVKCLSRDTERARSRLPAAAEIVQGDVHDPQSLVEALAGSQAAFYLVHSMEGSEFDFEERDRDAARNFAHEAGRAGVKRIVFLGGLGDEASQLSAHLRSRQRVGEILRAGEAPVTELRAGLIIGAGSASYVMLQQLVERLPLMITPRWVQTRTQPIAIDDVVRYLGAALNDDSPDDAVYEIGGPEVMTYRSMMMRYARTRGLKRFMLPVPVLTPRLSSYWVDVITDVPAALARPLIEGLRSEMIVRSDAAVRALGPPAVGFDEALAIAERSRTSRREAPLLWIRRLPRHLAGFARRRFLPPVVTDEQVRRTDSSAEALWKSAVAVGGRSGYPMLDPLWRIRGWVDRLIGGPGLNRSGPPAGEVRIGDKLDFWEVIELDPGHRLRLRALMKVPGDAELELAVHSQRGERILVQTGRFKPRGIVGRLYWWILYPIHLAIFAGMATRIVKRSDIE